MIHYLNEDRIPSMLESRLVPYYMEEMFRGKTKKIRDKASKDLKTLTERRRKEHSDFMEYYNAIK